MGKNKTLFIVVALALIFIVIFTGKAIGVQVLSATPGSANDPLITKSYVDEKLVAFEEQITSTVNELVKGINDQAPSEGGSELVVVELRDGEKLIGKAGTEIIVRTGEARIVAGENGIPNVTSGVDLSAGTIIPHNHLLIVPRDDGRGIQCVPGYPRVVYVMVRGGYSLDSQ